MSVIIAKQLTKANTLTFITKIDPSLQHVAGSIKIINNGITEVSAQLYSSYDSNLTAAKNIEKVGGGKIPANEGEMIFDCEIFGPGENLYVFTDSNDCTVRATLLVKA